MLSKLLCMQIKINKIRKDQPNLKKTPHFHTYDNTFIKCRSILYCYTKFPANILSAASVTLEL